MADRLADERFLIGAVDVDVSVAGIGVVSLLALEPEDPGQNEVVVNLRVFLLPLPHRFPPAKDRAARLTVSNLLLDPESTERRAVTALLTTGSVPGGGDGVNSDEILERVEEPQLLLFDRDFDEGRVFHGARAGVGLFRFKQCRS